MSSQLSRRLAKVSEGMTSKGLTFEDKYKISRLVDAGCSFDDLPDAYKKIVIELEQENIKQNANDCHDPETGRFCGTGEVKIDRTKRDNPGGDWLKIENLANTVKISKATAPSLVESISNHLNNRFSQLKGIIPDKLDDIVIKNIGMSIASAYVQPPNAKYPNGSYGLRLSDKDDSEFKKDKEFFNGFDIELIKQDRLPNTIGSWALAKGADGNLAEFNIDHEIGHIAYAYKLTKDDKSEWKRLYSKYNKDNDVKSTESVKSAAFFHDDKEGFCEVFSGMMNKQDDLFPKELTDMVREKLGLKQNIKSSFPIVKLVGNTGSVKESEIKFVQKVVNSVYSSPRFSNFIDKYGQMDVTYGEDPYTKKYGDKPRGAVVEGNTINIFKPGKELKEDSYEFDAMSKLVRHEYAHKIFNQSMSPSDREKFDKSLKEELSKTYTKNGSTKHDINDIGRNANRGVDEAYADLFAKYTDPTYETSMDNGKPGFVPVGEPVQEWVRNLAEKTFGDSNQKLNSNDCHDPEDGRFCEGSGSSSKITMEDLDIALETAQSHSYKGSRSDDEITLSVLKDYLFKPNMKSTLESANDKLNTINSIMKDRNVPYFDKKDLTYRVLTSPSLTGMDSSGNLIDTTIKEEPMPVYISANKEDKNTVGLMLHSNGKFEMFEGNEEASPETLDLVNDLLGIKNKMVTVYASHTSDVIDRIKNGDIPEGIYVSPDREHAAGYWGNDRELISFKVPMNRISQESDVDWKIRPKQNRRGKCPKDSYKDGTFECDPADSDAKEESSSIPKVEHELPRAFFMSEKKTWKNMISDLEKVGIGALTYKEGTDYDYKSQLKKHPGYILVDSNQNDIDKSMDLVYKYTKKIFDIEDVPKKFSEISSTMNDKEIKTELKSFYEAMKNGPTDKVNEWKPKKTSESDLIALAAVDLLREKSGYDSILKTSSPRLYKSFMNAVNQGKFKNLKEFVGYGKEYKDMGMRVREQQIAIDIIYAGTSFKGFSYAEKDDEPVTTLGDKNRQLVNVDEKSRNVVISKMLAGFGTELPSHEEVIGKYLAASMLMKTKDGLFKNNNNLVIKEDDKSLSVESLYKSVMSGTMISGRSKQFFAEYETTLNDPGRKNAFLVEFAYREGKVFKEEYPKTFEKVKSAVESLACGRDIANVMGGYLSTIKTHKDVEKERLDVINKMESNFHSVDRDVIKLIRSDKEIVDSIGYDDLVGAYGICHNNNDGKSSIAIDNFRANSGYKTPKQVGMTAVHEYTHAIITKVLGLNPRKFDTMDLQKMAEFFEVKNEDPEFKSEMEKTIDDISKNVKSDGYDSVLHEVTKSFIQSEENNRWYDKIIYGGVLNGENVAYVDTTTGLYNRGFTPTELLQKSDIVKIPDYPGRNEVNDKILLSGIARIIQNRRDMIESAETIYDTELLDTMIQVRSSLIFKKPVDWSSTKIDSKEKYNNLISSGKYGKTEREVDRNITDKLYNLPSSEIIPSYILDMVSTKNPSVSYQLLDKGINVFNADETIKEYMKSTSIPEEEHDDIITFIKGKWVNRLSDPENISKATNTDSDWVKMPSERMATFGEALWSDPKQTERLAPITTNAFRKALKQGKYGKVAQEVWK